MKKAKLFMMLALLVMGVSNLFAQNVTIRGNNGSTLAARPMGDTDYDIFFKSGGFATWKHEQLALTLTASDRTAKTANGQLDNPANNIFITEVNKSGTTEKDYLIQLAKGLGGANTNYISLALPKGYRFTGYNISFTRNSSKIGTGSDAYDASTSNGLEFGETDDNFNFTNSKTISYGGSESISREDMDGESMTNVLYFKLGGLPNERAIITLTHAEFYFTTEENYTPLTTDYAKVGVSAVNIPFETSKVDYGRISEEIYDGKERMSYSSANVKDLEAYITLYEEESTETVTEYDGTQGLGVKIQDGTITTENDNFFRVGGKKKDGKDVEQVYYVETPTYVKLSDGNKSPIGYRIVDAIIEYKKGSDHGAYNKTIEVEGEPIEYNTFYISATRSSYTRYLNSNGNASENNNTKWFIDENDYIRTGINGTTYLALSRDWDGNYYISVTDNVTYAQKWEIASNGQIKLSGNNNYIRLNYDDWNNDFYFDLTNKSNNRATRTEEGITSIAGPTVQQTVTIPAYKAGDFKIYKYDQTKKFSEEQSKEELDAPDTGSGKITLNNLNNDAIKFGIKGVGLVKITLTLQALDPYIDHLDIVCQEQGGQGGKLTQQFNATDFSVRGGKFTFYVPEGFNESAKFTFENLYSKYADNTYEDKNSKNHSRYSFVWSPYYEWIGSHGKNVYYTNPNHDYKDKIHTGKAGLKKYTFNNADEVNKDGGIFREYPFNAGLYGETNFGDFIFTQDEMDGNTTKTAYLFTCDETRYNIAPTTATQHTYYAYYEMTIDMHKKTYRPILNWEPIYNETFYSANNKDIKRDSKWGLKVTTEKVTDDQGKHSGYLTVTQILDAIKNGLPAVAAQGTTPAQPAVQGLDPNNKVAPKNMDQILYIDSWDLMSIVENQTEKVDEQGNAVIVEGKPQYDSHLISELRKDLDKNALVYLPYGSTANYDNFAFNTIAKYNETDKDGNIIKEIAPIFRGANNIVITDRYPFYAPFDIQVPSANMAKYERTLTNQALYGDDDQNLTIILPFEINVDKDGIHTNNDGAGKPFKLSTMNKTNALSKKSNIDYGTENAEGKGYFTIITEKSEPNKPYVVTMQGGTESSFKVHVNGSLVKATPDKIGRFDDGQTSTGTYDGATYTFTHEGTYTGIEIGDEKKGGAAKATTTVFYFANNFFLDSKTLGGGKSLKMLPFRSYYEYTVSGGNPGAKMTSFRIVFGENDEMGGTNGINEIQRDADLAVIPGDGSITLMARADKDVTIHAVSGITVDKCSLRAGETRTVSVPAGVYVINGVKMVVK